MMMTSTTTAGRRTPLYDYHLDHGAKVVDFAGWDMPLHYGSILQEHRQVREAGGIFDVSHMGRLRFTGRDACRFLDRICTRQIAGMADGQARYSLICNERGGCRDDVLVYRIKDSEYLMVCNAANREKLLNHFEQTRDDLTFKLKDETESTAMVAIQGPKVMEIISRFSSEVPNLKRYRFTQKNLIFAKVLISRTGYTGEDGVEVIFPAKFAGKAIDLLMSKGGDNDDFPIRPAGLGARDSLRLEAGMALYGHEITEDIDPVSAGLNFAISFNKGEDDPSVEPFIGQDAINQIRQQGPAQLLTGLILEGKRAARQGAKVFSDGGSSNEVGFVTSGCFSPTLEQSIAMAYVQPALAEPGTTVHVDLGRTTVQAQTTKIPFYKAGA